jgi:hypothetical protein
VGPALPGEDTCVRCHPTGGAYLCPDTVERHHRGLPVPGRPRRATPKLFAEVDRPTFSRLSPPLVDLCRFIAFSALRDQLSQVRSFVRYLNPEFLDEVCESCVLDDA